MAAHLILIDALNLIRRVYAVQERPFIQIKQQDSDELSASTLKQVLFNTQKTCVNALTKIIEQHAPTHALAVFDSQQPCWRYQLFEGYKKGRKQMPDHLSNKLIDIQDAFMEQGVDSLTSDEDEADDLIATLAVKMAIHGQKVTIISTDKGFLQLLSPNIHIYDYFNRRYMDEEHVQNKFNVKYSQLIDFWTLTGDNTNKIEGVSGIGQVNAAKLLNQYGSLKAILNATDLKSSLSEKLTQSLEQMDLARKLLTLKQDIPLGFNLKDIRLTTPSPAAEINGNIISINAERS
ncbi:flap endonuclease Xni [Colwellia sp. 12G3]|uniref:flap endonuclease Xni n=1 Tax=Colwellia sp. 12G3 TaxID=2058299 RepID=UPI000C34B803|nr:flap endonuclease Xni [Colwellia sp. 12G3]PKI16925.1 flap endonuclease Xni [Colwellia sp. 12G3]